MIALAGLALAAVLMARAGFGEILRTLMTAGWGLLWLAPYRLVPVTLDAAGWRLLLPRHGPHVPFPYLVWAAAVRDAATSLLPLSGPAGIAAGVEGTVTLVSQLLFVVAGIALFLLHPLSSNLALLNELVPLLLGALPFIVLIVLLQSKAWVFHWMEPLTDRLADRLRLPGLVGGPTRLHEQLAALYAQPYLVARSGLWQLAGLFAGAGEVWLALRLFDQPVTLASAVLLQSVGQAARTTAFMVPGGVGVQEAGFVLAANLVGLGPHVGLALAFAKRFRELVFGVPFLMSWHWFEGRRLMLRRSAGRDLES
jgi:hypothetical protein